MLFMDEYMCKVTDLVAAMYYTTRRFTRGSKVGRTVPIVKICFRPHGSKTRDECLPGPQRTYLSRVPYYGFLIEVFKAVDFQGLRISLWGFVLSGLVWIVVEACLQNRAVEDVRDILDPRKDQK